MFISGKRHISGRNISVNVDDIRTYKVCKQKPCSNFILIKLDIILTGRRAWLHSGKMKIWVEQKEFRKMTINRNK